MPKSKELEELLRKLSVIQENCYDVVIDLSKIKFHSDDEEMYIHDEITDTRYHFKMSKENPEDPVRTNAQRQLCKRIGVPFQFFMANRPAARNLMVKQWLAATAPASASEDGEANLMMLRVREGGLTKVIRAILPVSYSALSTFEIINTLALAPDNWTVDVDEDTLAGIERDSLWSHIRLNYSLDLGGEYFVGLAITTSEVGTSDLIIDAFLYNKEWGTYATASYGNKPFSTIVYSKVQPKEIQDLLSAIPSRIEEEAKEFMLAIGIDDNFLGFERSTTILGKLKGVSRKFQRSMLLESQTIGDEVLDMKSFVRHAGMVAKGSSINERIKLERAIGTFGGLRFSKK